MATELVDASKLNACCTAEANAIRAKTGSSSQIAYDWANSKGFADAIAAIPAGGGDFSANDVAACGNSTIRTVNISVNIEKYAFYGWNITSASGTSTRFGNGCFQNCTSLTSISFPNMIGDADSNFTSCFQGCTALTSVYLPLQQIFWNFFFRQCTALQVIALPSWLRSNASTFHDCSNLETIDLGNATQESTTSIQGNEYYGCSKLTKLIIRHNTYNSLSTLSAFDGTPFASDGPGGTLYVPSALISTYQSANIWSTILGYPNNSIAAIEGSPYENYYADGTPVT